jgi:DNA primase
MGKISPVSAKYIIHTNITIEGVVDRPDVIGAIFGQTEGLLGEDLELRELQRSGRIGRIEVNLETRNGKTSGSIIIPSSLDKAETVIIAAALETIQRIGPCNSRVKAFKIEDVRISKRSYVIERAKELLKNLTDSVLPDSQEMTEEVAQSVRVMEIVEYGKDRLPAGPYIDESEEVIIVEGRADVLNLLKHGFKNSIALNGTSVPQTIIDLTKQKTVTIFVDGDRGGDLILKELSLVAELDFICRAPDGKEVEEITKKEIHKALRNKIAFEQVKMEIAATKETLRPRQPIRNERPRYDKRPSYPPRREFNKPMFRKPRVAKETSDNFKKMLDDLIGTRGAFILDGESKILGKVPTSELQATVKSLSNVQAIVLDGEITPDIVEVAERANVKFIVGRDSKVKHSGTRVNVLTNSDL